MINIDQLIIESTELLKNLIETQSFSREEELTAQVLNDFFTAHHIKTEKVGNNIIAYNLHVDETKPYILLNSHHDTVKPNPGYTKDPFKAIVEDGKLFGLGSNDAGGCLVSLIAVFRYYYDRDDLAYNLCLVASSEEEVSGREGLERAYKHIKACDFAIIGEPTLLNLAVAEKGLMVLDCESIGKSGHAAREEGENAIYKAIQDINWFKEFEFPKKSEFLGPIKMSVTMIEAGSQHNVVPASCKFVVDVRTTEVYNNLEVLDIIRRNVQSSVEPRSTRLNPSSISIQHPVVLSGISLGKELYGSPTMSDQAILSIPSIKVGPGDSARSHSADEFIYLQEIDEGIRFYIDLLKGIL